MWLGCCAFAILAACPSQQPQTAGTRVVSLVPSITETIYALGAGDRLAGTTTYCDYPEAARLTYKVGDFANPDIERIQALRPALVFLTLPVHQLVAEKLKEAGIPVYVSRPDPKESRVFWRRLNRSESD